MPTDTTYCGECGAKLPATAKFCTACGTQQTPLPVPINTDDTGTIPPREESADVSAEPALVGGAPGEGPRSGPETATPAGAGGDPRVPYGQRGNDGIRERADQVAPGAGELADELLTRLNTPGMVSASIIGGVAFAATLVAGILVGLAAPTGSFLRGLIGEDVGGFGRVLVAAAGIAGGHNNGSLIAPLVFFAVPVGAAFLAARVVAPRLSGLNDATRMLWSAAGALIFALLMLVVALIANGQDGVNLGTGSVFLAALVVALIGIVPGAVVGARSASPEREVRVLPTRATVWLRLLIPSLRALAAVYLVALMVTAIVWTVQSVRDQPLATANPLAGALTAVTVTGDEDFFGRRSVPGAVVENLLFAPDYAVSVTATSLLAQDEYGGPYLPGSAERRLAALQDVDAGGKGGIFDLNDFFPVYVFLPILVVLLGAVLLAGLYAGFATARRAGPSTPALGAAFGVLTGPVWALTMVFVRELSGWTTQDGGSTFLWTLLVGTVLGAVGGFLATGGGRRSAGQVPRA